MLITGIDIGVKNMAFCLFDSETNQIYEWEVFEIGDGSISNLIKGFDQFMYQKLVNYDTDEITFVIEKQPFRNAKMRRIEAYTECYCNMTFPDSQAHILHAKTKLNDPTLKGKNNYTARKKLAIDRVTEYIQKNTQDVTIVEKFNKTKKKDDLSDTLLLALYYSENPIKKTMIRSSKTTTKSVAKLTKSNIKYILSNADSDIYEFIENNTYLKNAIKKFYVDPVDCIDEMIFS